MQANNRTQANVHLRMHGKVAVLRLDNPPVNAGSHALRQGLVDGIARAGSEGAEAAVLIGEGRCFIAGSDLREFGKPLVWPELPDVIRAMEDAPFPVVAAMHGVALGGGFELALGCDYRLAAPGTMVGLPEVSLGLIPGAGGTQRLPLLIGRARAIELICAARRISADEALSAGLIDRVVAGGLLEGALLFLSEAVRPKRRTLSMNPPPEDEALIGKAAATAMRRGKGRPNVAHAIRLVRTIADTDREIALADERAVFQQLRLAEDAVALRYLFFAERRASLIDGLDLAQGGKTTRVGVVGGGTMGQGIVRCFLAAGFPVVLVERNQAALDKAVGAIAASLDAAVDKGRLAADDMAARKAGLSGAVDYSAFAHCDLVIEAVFEEMSIKQEVLARLEAVVPQDALIATNTSYLDIDDMAAGLAHPQRVLGLHFFSPADIMPLLEVVRAQTTSDRVLATALKLAHRLGKQPVVAHVAEGFIGNRVYAAYRRRAELLVLDGASPLQVDRAATDFGFAMGPFAVADMSGLDIAWVMRKRQAATRDPKARYVDIPDTLCEVGRLGRKAGKGWYDYSEGNPVPSAEVTAIIAEARCSAGIAPMDYEPGTIQRQLLAAIVNEAAMLIDEGVAQRPSDVDVVLSNGYGFPRWRGGPLFWAAQQDRAALQADHDTLRQAVGHGARDGPVDRVLDQIKTEIRAE